MSFKDEFSDFEQIYLRMSRTFAHLGKEHWALHLVVKIDLITPDSPKISAELLQKAWQHLLYQHPGLSVTPLGTRKIFRPLDRDVADEWLNKTFRTVIDRSADAVISESGCLDLPILVFLPSSSDIVFISQHWRHDALGSFMMMQQLLENLSRLLQEQELVLADPLSVPAPSLEDVANADEWNDAGLQEYAKDYIDSIHRKAVNAGGLPYLGDSEQTPGVTCHEELTFAPSRTESIVSACRANKISVTSAIHTALAQTVLSDAAPERRAHGYTTVVAMNLRDQLPEPAGRISHACQIYITGLTPTVSEPENFMQSASQLTHEYRHWYSDQFRRALRWIYRYHSAKLFSPAPVTQQPSRPPSGVTLSSLGIVERYLSPDFDSLEIIDVRFGASIYTRQTLLYAWTFRKQLCLSMDYNAAYHSEGMVKEVLRQLRTNLERGLKIDSIGV